MNSSLAEDLETIKQYRQFDEALAYLIITECRDVCASKMDTIIHKIRKFLDPRLPSGLLNGISPKDDAAAACAKRGPKKKRPPAPTDNMKALMRTLAEWYVKEYLENEPKQKRRARKMANSLNAKLRTFLSLHIDKNAKNT